MFRFRFTKFRIVLFTLLLSLSFCMPVFASYSAYSGVLQPCTYVFDLALNASGVKTFKEYLDMWYNAYRLYLEQSGSASAKNHFSAVESLNWGDSCSESAMSNLISDVSDWLDHCSYSANFFFSPMSSPSPLKWVSADEPYSVQFTPFSIQDADKNLIVTSGEFDYLYSAMWLSGDYVCVQNLYVPKGTEVFACWSGYFGYCDMLEVQFYQKDNSAVGYSPCTFYSIEERYDFKTHKRIDGSGATYYTPVSSTVLSTKCLSSLPFPVLLSDSFLSSYAKGEDYIASKQGFYSFLYGARMSDIFEDTWELESVSAFTLPDSASSGENILSQIFDVIRSDTGYIQMRNVMQSSAGFTIRWVPWSYTVNYLCDDSLSESVTLSVSPDENRVSEVPPLEKEGYRLKSSPYSPALPAVITPENNSISVFYESWTYPYTVNYYYDSVLKKQVSLSVPSYANKVGSVPLPSSLMYQLSEAPYVPELPTVIDAEHSAIDVYYTSGFSESVSSGFRGIFQSLGRFLTASVPYALGIVGLMLLVFLVVRFYRRISKKG